VVVSVEHHVDAASVEDLPKTLHPFNAGTDLRRIRGITAERLVQKAMSLEGATMPDGQKYEDWLKSRGEEGKNSGPS
jgi:hypothetical protein